MSFVPTPKQLEATELMAGSARHILLRGGSRSGKTFIIVRSIVVRMLRKESSHAVLRYRFNHLKESIIGQTLPSVMKVCFPEISYTINKTDWFAKIGPSTMLFGGLDDKERTEKILGQEHSSIYLNECSQINYGPRNKAVTRLAQNSGLPLRAYYDENPPTAAHWTYRMFMQKVEPQTRLPLSNPNNYVTLQMNPKDNLANLPPDYLEELENLPERERRRFLQGEFLSELPGALWGLDVLERNRVTLNDVPPLTRIVIAVDPSGCEGEEDKRSDEIGIIAAGVAGRGKDAVGYLLEDASGHYSPSGWARKALELRDVWNADCIVAERNFGGAMVESTIRTEDPMASVKIVTASRGKIRRAEPVAAIYEKNRIKHVGEDFQELEDQYLSFTTSGYEGSTSPDRADAAVWAFTDLMVEKQSTLSFGTV